MAKTISVHVTGIEGLKRKLAKLSPDQNRKILSESLLECAHLVQIEAAEKQIIQGSRFFVAGPRGGRSLKDAPVHPTRLTSRRGGAGLVGSISVNRQPLPFAIEVGTHLGYGRIHELGEGRYPKRAFLEPAVAEKGDRFPEVFMKHWKRLAGV